MVCFIISFLVLMALHEDVGNVFLLEHAMTIEMAERPFGPHSRHFRDVNDVPTLWEWVELGLLPTVVHHEDAAGNRLPHHEWGFLAGYNRIIGGVRFVQERSKSRECGYSSMSAYYGECQPIETDDHSSFGYPECGTFNADELDDYDRGHNLTACYDTSEFQGFVDLLHDEGFTVDSTTNLFEMCVGI